MIHTAYRTTLRLDYSKLAIEFDPTAPEKVDILIDGALVSNCKGSDLELVVSAWRTAMAKAYPTGPPGVPKGTTS